MGYELRYDGAVQQRSSIAADLFRFTEIATANNAKGVPPEEDPFVAAANQREIRQTRESVEESTEHRWSDEKGGTIRPLGDAVGDDGRDLAQRSSAS